MVRAHFLLTLAALFQCQIELCQATLDMLPMDSSYMADSWAMLSSRSSELSLDTAPSTVILGGGHHQHQVGGGSANACVAIPRNFSLCHGIDYDKMRLPNLLDHETLDEAVQQSQPWIPLLRLNCHVDTKLFLCSLFAPVCLERAIYPCQSLCEAVKSGCEKRMQAYGFPWPEMLHCAKFPVSNDMCIQPRENYQINKSCDSCNQVETFENILDHFCRSDYVFKVKLNKVTSDFVEVKRGRAIKFKEQSHSPPMNLNGLKLKLSYHNHSCPCSAVSQQNLGKRFLVMANLTSHGEYTLNLILPWKKDKMQFKRAQRMFRKLDCKTLGTKIRERARRERSRANGQHRKNSASNATSTRQTTNLHKRRQHQGQQHKTNKNSLTKESKSAKNERKVKKLRWKSIRQ